MTYLWIFIRKPEFGDLSVGLAEETSCLLFRGPAILCSTVIYLSTWGLDSDFTFTIASSISIIGMSSVLAAFIIWNIRTQTASIGRHFLLFLNETWRHTLSSWVTQQNNKPSDRNRSERSLTQKSKKSFCHYSRQMFTVFYIVDFASFFVQKNIYFYVKLYL